MKRASALVFLLLSVVFGVTLVLWLAFESQEKNDPYRKIIETIAALSAQESRIHQSVITLRYGLNSNYDEITEINQRIKQLSQQLALEIPRSSLKSAIGEYQKLVFHNEELIEDFKFRNAVIQNSLRYFQHDTLALSAALSHDAGGDSARFKLTRLINSVLRLTLGADPNIAEDLSAQLQAIKGELSTRTLEERNTIERIMSHARLVQRHLGALDEATEALIGGEPQTHLEEMARLAQESISQEAQRAAQYRSGLTFIAALFLVLFAMLGMRYADRLRERLNAIHELSIAGRFFQGSEQGMVITDQHGTILRVNPAFCRITGYSEHELLGQNPRLLNAGLTPASVYHAMWQTLSERGSWQGEIRNRRKNGEIYVEWLHIDALQTPGEAVQYIGIFSDITEVVEARERLSLLAYYDTLTGLPNRILLMDRLAQGLALAKAEQHQLAVLLIDLDNFKSINDSMGHAAGDALLQEAAIRIQSCLNPSDTLARMGGDEFAVLLYNPGGKDGVCHIVTKIIKIISEPFQIDHYEIASGASAGITYFPDDGELPEQLLRNADGAMYRAKEQGKNGFEFYRPEMTSRALETMVIQSQLRQAIARNEFTLHYQPQFNRAGIIVGAEALLRWDNEELGRVSSERFIPIAEKTGLINSIGDWVLQQSCQQAALWRQQLAPQLRVAINLSAAQFRQPDIVAKVEHALREAKLPGSAIELELTESIMMKDIRRAQEVMGGFKSLGCTLAIDDFGTGYSSLNYLKQLPVDVLKIDKSFVDGLGVKANDTAVVRAIISLAHNLELDLIAEGVENRAQLETLQAMGANREMLIQGFLLGRPMAAAQLETVLASQI